MAQEKRKISEKWTCEERLYVIAIVTSEHTRLDNNEIEDLLAIAQFHKSMLNHNRHGILKSLKLDDRFE